MRFYRPDKTLSYIKENADALNIPNLSDYELDLQNGKITPEDTQTINALLKEMDGFSERSGIFVIAATNYSNVLDKFLLLLPLNIFLSMASSIHSEVIKEIPFITAMIDASLQIVIISAPFLSYL